MAPGGGRRSCRPGRRRPWRRAGADRRPSGRGRAGRRGGGRPRRRRGELRTDLTGGVRGRVQVHVPAARADCGQRRRPGGGGAARLEVRLGQRPEHRARPDGQGQRDGAVRADRADVDVRRDERPAEAGVADRVLDLGLGVVDEHIRGTGRRRVDRGDLVRAPERAREHLIRGERAAGDHEQERAGREDGEQALHRARPPEAGRCRQCGQVDATRQAPRGTSQIDAAHRPMRSNSPRLSGPRRCRGRPAARRRSARGTTRRGSRARHARWAPGRRAGPDRAGRRPAKRSART